MFSWPKNAHLNIHPETFLAACCIDGLPNTSTKVTLKQENKLLLDALLNTSLLLPHDTERPGVQILYSRNWSGWGTCCLLSFSLQMSIPGGLCVCRTTNICSVCLEALCFSGSDLFCGHISQCLWWQQIYQPIKQKQTPTHIQR